MTTHGRIQDFSFAHKIIEIQSLSTFKQMLAVCMFYKPYHLKKRGGLH